MLLVLVGLCTVIWCVFHSLLVTHWWRDRLRRLPHGLQAVHRLIYALGSTVTLAVLLLWTRSLPQQMLWDWPGWWSWVRWLGLIEAGYLFWQGARIFDGRSFLGLRQLADMAAGRPPRDPAFRTEGILETIRHPWYTGALLVLICSHGFTDVNLVWRGVFFVYILIGTELEERKLLADLGETYAEYRRRVPRFLPIRWG